MRTDEFTYHLPPELIAQQPAPERTAARMMVLERAGAAIRHCQVRDLTRILRPNDLLVLNDTKVMPARLIGRKADTGGRVEILLVEEVASDEWEALWSAARPPRPGGVWQFADGRISAEVLQPPAGDTIRLRLHYNGNLPDILEACGQTPLPPYIKRCPADNSPAGGDRQRYQTVYARFPGAVAAPTAGLHFTEELLNELAAHGIGHTTITLHVGPGTFRPVTSENIEDHRMDAERYIVPDESAEAIQKTRAAGGRVIAVGSTVVRTLETVAAANEGVIVAGAGRSALFIKPPYAFRAIDAMLTNFHLPASTLLMMVSAWAGVELTRRAYAVAVQEQYRFYSYGDCMLIL